MKTWTSYINDIPRIINNSSSDNLTWAEEQVNDAMRYLTTRYFWNETSYNTTVVSGQQFYNLPSDIDKMINAYVTIGAVRWQMAECSSRRMWDALNVIQFNQEFPYYYFIYDGTIGIWPTPTNNTDTLTINYKHRIVDLSMVDVTDTTQGTTINVTNGTTTILASAGTTIFYNWMAGYADLRIPFTNTSTSGDNVWYPIATVQSGTTAFLKTPYMGASVTGASFTIGQVPLLWETYQDLPLYRMAYIYYTTRFPDPSKAQLYQGLYDRGLAQLDAQFANKSTNVVLSDENVALVNPNLYTPTNLTKI